MPFNPIERNEVPQLIQGAGQQLSGALQRIQAQIEEEKRQKEYNGTVLGVLTGAGSSDGSGPPSPAVMSILQNVMQGGTSAQQGGALAGLQLLNQIQEQKRRAKAAEDQAGFVPTPADFDRTHSVGYELVPTGHGRFRPVPRVTDSGEKSFTPPPEQVDAAKKSGLVWLQTSPTQGRWVPANAPGSAPGFSDHLNDTLSRDASSFGLSRSDLDGIDAKTPNVIAYQDGAGKPLSTESALKLGNDAFAVGSANGTSFKVPLPKFQSMINQRDLLNRQPPANSGSQPPGIVGSPPQAGGVDANAALAQARAKIRAGGDPNLVRQRLQKLGIDPGQL